MKFKHLKKCIIGGIAAVGIAVTGYAVSAAYADTQQGDTILDNIYIGEVAVGGMTADEAEQAVRDYVQGMQDTKLTLTAGSKSILVSLKRLGVEWENTGVVEEASMIGKSGSLITRYKDKKDLEHAPREFALTFRADESKITSYLKKYKKKADQKAKDGGLVRENGAFTITEGKEGISLNVAESAKRITSFIQGDWDAKEAEIELAADTVKPRGTKEELAKVKDVLGTCTTDYSSSTAGRIMNVETGCSRINGKLLYPGDTFSVYETVSPFDAEHGYALAGSFENGTVVDTYGGGICQVSTTLYDAVILAELEIKERFEHSMIVTYVEPSMDAAIAGTVKDLKFVNNLDTPVYIEGITGGGKLTFNIYGEETRPANREVSFESEIISETQPPTQLQGSASYNVGYVGVQQSSHVGKVAKLWKVVKVDGKEKSREEFNNSTYYASPTIITVGTNTTSDEARAYIQNAIASQNAGNIYAAAQQAAAIAARPPEPEEPDPDEEDPNEEKPDEEKPDGEEPDQKDNDKDKDKDKDSGQKDDGKQEEPKKDEEKGQKPQATQKPDTPKADSQQAQPKKENTQKAETKKEEPQQEPQKEEAKKEVKQELQTTQ